MQNETNNENNTNQTLVAEVDQKLGLETQALEQNENVLTTISPAKAAEEIESTVETVEDVNDFENFDLSPEVKKALAKLNFTKATPVQKATIPFLLEEDRDIVALAKTGTGKTAAFGLPLIEKLEIGGGLQGLILCPTRELAQQVATNIKSFGEFKKAKVATVVGGESYDRQIRALNTRPEILVSTPGRLVDLLDQNIVNLADIKYLILDEADEMLSFGFEEALETIWGATDKENLRTWLFSATMPKAIRNLAARHLKNAHEVTLTSKEEKSLVESFACVIFEEDKEDALSLLIKNEPEFYGIIFATTKKQVADLEIKLRSLGLDVDSLHGDKVQADRTRTIERMKSKRTKILVATDVAARGLDIQNLTHVVNFEIPWDVETYTHRIGRTGRAGKAGIVWTMVKPKESTKLVKFERAIGTQFKNLRIPLVEEVQVKQKVTWLKEISTRKLRETDVTKFEKAVENLNIEELTALSHETKTWLAKALDYFGQGEELRMKQPRSLELRAREARSGGEYSDRQGGGYRDRQGGGEYRRRDGGGFRSGGRSSGGGGRDRDRYRAGDRSLSSGGGEYRRRESGDGYSDNRSSFAPRGERNDRFEKRDRDFSGDRAPRSSDRGESAGDRGNRSERPRTGFRSFNSSGDREQKSDRGFRGGRR